MSERLSIDSSQCSACLLFLGVHSLCSCNIKRMRVMIGDCKKG